MSGKPTIDREPADDLVLDVNGGVVTAPAIRVHRGGEVVGVDADRVRRCVDESEKTRVRVAHRERHHVLAHEVEDLLERPALLGQRAGEEGSVRSDLSENGPLEKLLAVLGDSVGGEPAEPADFVGR